MTHGQNERNGRDGEKEVWDKESEGKKEQKDRESKIKKRGVER